MYVYKNFQVKPLAFIAVCVLSLGFCSCAGIYKPFRKGVGEMSIKKPINLAQDSIIISIDSDPLAINYNKRYRKLFYERGVNTYLIKVENNSSNDLNIGSDLLLVDINEQSVQPLSKEMFYYQGKQRRIGLYFLYGFLFAFPEFNGDVIPIPYGLPIGLGNFIAAAASNSSFKKDIEELSNYPSVIPANSKGYFFYGTSEGNQIYSAVLK